mgnify:CR=1 FL=1
MVGLLERCFPDRMPAWRPALQEAMPSYGRRLSEDPTLLAQVRADTMQVLELTGWPTGRHMVTTIVPRARPSRM